jgi:FAD/FMN-containing dehydrogenase/Fe-S oxidoreductase
MATRLEDLQRVSQTGEQPHWVGVEALAAELSQRITGEVRFGPGDRALYAADASNYRQVPIGVVIPKTIEDVVQTVAACRRHGAPILARGAGTSLAGQSCNVAVVMDFTKYLHEVLEINAEERWARVRPGLVLDELRRAAEPHGLTFGPDPATHRWCTLGGMIGNNSCGVHSIMAEELGAGPRMEHQVVELEILTYDGLRMRVGETSEEELERVIREGGRRGEIYRQLRELRDRYAGRIREGYPELPRRVSGYNLPQLLPENGFNLARALVGSECTCVIVLEAKVRLIPARPKRALLVLGYPSVYEAGDHVPELRKLHPLGLEGMDQRLIDYLTKKELYADHIGEIFPDGDGWLLVEFGADTQEAAIDQARSAMEALRRGGDAPEMMLHTDPERQKEVWEIRESGLAATAWVPGEDDTWPGWEDSAVPPAAVGDYLRELRDLFDEHGYDAALYGHFGDGCIHCRINFNLANDEDVGRYRRFIHAAADLVLKHGGSLSGEHGDGQARGELLDKMYGPELVQAFREFKRIWDPAWMMNPGKVVDSYGMTEDLRIGHGFDPPEVETHFHYPQDGNRFARATIRCVGVGKCRRLDGGVMCPSYMVLHEEKHTTRGRAHLLFEMLEGDPVTELWKSEEVKESLDLCLSCKGCTGECPVNVDIPTFKAEFLAHYYEGRLRPLHAYAFGLIYWWARLASRMPRLVNLLSHAPLLSDAAKWLVDMPQQREIPHFAPETFTRWFRSRRGGLVTGTEVMLWPDTFTNHFQPEIARAAVEVLEDAGCRVTIPERALCCGRPLYEFGMLDLAKRQLRQILDELRPQIRRGVKIVGLEPSCVSVFQEELPNLFPGDADAERLKEQVCTLAEFLDEIRYEPPRLDRRILLHGHCHHRSVLDWEPEPALLKQMGAEVDHPDSGCCGMAGAFGFEKQKYDVSIACGERVLLPKVREADDETLIVTDGFSCREQISQCTGREALHLAEVVRLALKSATQRPERLSMPQRTERRLELPRPRLATALLFGAGVAVGAALTRTIGARMIR